MSLLSIFKTYSLFINKIESVGDDFYKVHLTKPQFLTWAPGAYAQFLLTNIKDPVQNNRWLTITTLPKEKEIILLTRCRIDASEFKKKLIQSPIGTKVLMKWLAGGHSIKSNTPIICFASDVGITALRPLVSKYANSNANIIIYHLSKGCHVFDEELRNFSAHHNGIQFVQSDTLEDIQDLFETACQQYKNEADYLLVGQTDDINHIHSILTSNKIHSKQIKLEHFKGLK